MGENAAFERGHLLLHHGTKSYSNTKVQFEPLFTGVQCLWYGVLSVSKIGRHILSMLTCMRVFINLRMISVCAVSGRCSNIMELPQRAHPANREAIHL